MTTIITTKNIPSYCSAFVPKIESKNMSLNCTQVFDSFYRYPQENENNDCEITRCNKEIVGVDTNAKKNKSMTTMINASKYPPVHISSSSLQKLESVDKISCSIPVHDCFDHQPLENDTCDNSITHNQTSCFSSEECDYTVVSDGSKENSLPQEKIQNMPLDYRIDLSSEMKNNLASCLSSYPSILDLNDMELADDNSCISIDISESDMESIHSDSFEVDENISSIPQWTTVDVWNI